MVSFVEKLENLCKEYGVSKNQLLTDLELSKNSFVDWKKRGTIPNGDVLSKIADYFGLTMEELLSNAPKPKFVSKILFLIDLNCQKASTFISECNLPKNIFSLWINKGLKPTSEELIRIAKYFNVQVEYLANDEFQEPHSPYDLNMDELFLINYYRDPQATQKTIQNHLSIDIHSLLHVNDPATDEQYNELLKGLSQLSPEQIKQVRSYVDFIASQKNSK